jgi:hypothetical protein
MMTNESKGKHLKLWTPANYLIEVEGHLDESWSDRLGGMRITTRKRADDSIVTTLTGRMRDQAELSGVLNNLYELHLPILSVKTLSENNGEEGQDRVESTHLVLESEDDFQNGTKIN